MEPESSLPCSQQLSTCSCFKPDETSLRFPASFLKISFTIKLPSNARSCKWSLSLSFPHHSSVYTSTLSHNNSTPRNQTNNSKKKIIYYRRFKKRLLVYFSRWIQTQEHSFSAVQGKVSLWCITKKKSIIHNFFTALSLLYVAQFQGKDFYSYITDAKLQDSTSDCTPAFWHDERIGLKLDRKFDLDESSDSHDGNGQINWFGEGLSRLKEQPPTHPTTHLPALKTVHLSVDW